MKQNEPRRSQPASSELARDINRRTVLGLIRTRQPISRADLARASGMQRSTISLIVNQLVEEQWVVEGPTGRLPRGRRPTFLRLNDDRSIIVIDIRPIQTTLALSDINGRFTYQEVFATPADPARALETLLPRVQAVARLAAGKKLEGIGISLPGRFHSGHLVFAPNLHWRDVDLRTPLAEATGLDVELENAANACVLSSAWFDRAHFCRNMVVVTVSEGIGTGLLVNGRLAHGVNNMAGEFGHVSLDPKGPPCACGGRGCWETLASNAAALRYYGGTAALSFPDLLNLAEHGDTRARRALDSMARWLGRGMRMLASGLAPERIVVVGDLTRSWSFFGPIIEAELHGHVLAGGVPPVVSPSHEDGLARLRGSVALVLQKHFGALGSSVD